MRNLDLHYSFQVHEPSGLLVEDSGIRPAHSFTIGFAKILFNFSFWLAGFTPTATTDTGGSSRTSPGDTSLGTSATTSTDTYGIQVGTSTAAESINDTALGTKISTGTSAGNLQYGSMTYAAPSTTATTTTFRCTRVFTNGSGGTVTVQEIGLVSSSISNAYKYLLIRDLTGAVAVNNGQQLTVNYDFTTTI